MPSRSQQHAVAVVRRAPVRHVLHSLARVMASYFCNLHMFVFPSHCVKKMPPLHVNYRISERVVPLPRDDVTATLTDESLGEAWTSEKTLELLLLSGCLCGCRVVLAIGRLLTSLLSSAKNTRRLLRRFTKRKKNKCLNILFRNVK